jgi:hypothetical protein
MSRNLPKPLAVPSEPRPLRLPKPMVAGGRSAEPLRRRTSTSPRRASLAAHMAQVWRAGCTHTAFGYPGFQLSRQNSAEGHGACWWWTFRPSP